MKLKDKVTLVTAARLGIEKVIAKLFARGVAAIAGYCNSKSEIYRRWLSNQNSLQETSFQKQ